MANEEHLALIRQGVEVWNQWREENPTIIPDLKGAELSYLDLNEVDFREADLQKAQLEETNLYGANLSGADLSEVDLYNSDLTSADLSKVNFQSAYISETNLNRSNLQYANFSKADIFNVSFSGANLSKVNLTKADLSYLNFNKVNLRGSKLIAANLSGADFSNADLTDADLSEAILEGTNLAGAELRRASLIKTTFNRLAQGDYYEDTNLSNANLSEASLSEAKLFHSDFSGAILRRANLSGAILNSINLNNADLTGIDLSRVDLSGFDLNGFNFSEVNLTEANLSRTQALGTNFTGAEFTGACLEDWHINSRTKLDDIKCLYVYLQYPNQERRPSNGEFAPGEFTKLFQKALSTVDLIFRNGVDWEALLISLEKLRIEAEGAELSIQAIENKNDGAFVVRVNVPPEANKAEVEKFLKQEYELALKAIDERYQYQLKLQGERLEEYRDHVAVQRQENTDLRRIIEKMADKESSKVQQNFYAQVNSVTGNVEGDQNIYISQNLAEAAEEIQKLLAQLQTQGMTEAAAQQTIATEMAKQAENNPTSMGKLVQWGKSMANKAGETTVSEATKTVLTIALRMAGIPLP